MQYNVISGLNIGKHVILRNASPYLAPGKEGTCHTNGGFYQMIQWAIAVCYNLTR